MRIPTRTLITGAVVLLASAGLAAEEEAPPPPRPECARLASAGGERGPLGPGQQEAIVEALQDEYAGEAVYGRVLKDLGDVRPFSNVAAGAAEEPAEARAAGSAAGRGRA